MPVGGVAVPGVSRRYLWREGVFRYEQDRFVEVRAVDDQPLRDVSCFKADPDGTIWMGTRTRGLLRWRDGRLSAIGSPAGFPIDVVHAILDVGLGYFWMPSNRGIVRAARMDLHAVADGTKARLDCQLLDEHDGLPSAECSTSQPSCARDTSGRLWFATHRGVAMIDPASFHLNSLLPPVLIVRLDYHSSSAGSRTRNRPPSGDSGAAQVRLLPPWPEPFRLPPGSYGLEFEYTALSFSTPEKLRFPTRLKGISRDWELADLERIRQAHAELAHLSRVTMLGELSGSLAHELNQPLTAILSNAQAAQRFLAHDTVDLDELRDILKDIVDEDKRAGEVIRRLRLLLKKGEVQHQPIEVNEVVLDVLKLVRGDLVNQGVTTHTELAPGLPLLRGDRVQLQQVLLNLVMNACDAVAGGPAGDRKLIIRTALAEGEGIRVSVADRGVGLAPDHLEKVFEPFFTTKPHGMGLGLSVCRTIITAHGGKLWAENNPDRGATFHFTHPAPKS